MVKLGLTPFCETPCKDIDRTVKGHHFIEMIKVSWGYDMGLKSETGYPRVDAVIASIEAGDDWDIASSASNAYLYQLLATQNIGIFEPFTPEQTALNDYLAANRAGKRLCDYAWRLFAQSL